MAERRPWHLAGVSSAGDVDARDVDLQPQHRRQDGIGALGGFEYVAIHAGECRNPERTIARSVALAAPIIAVMFILGTSSVLALVPIERIDLIAPIPQVLAEGFTPFGSASAVATLTILALLCIRIAQASVLFAGNTRLPMVAGWDGLLPQWFTRMHPRFQTPVNSIIFVGAITLAFSIFGLIGVGKQEAFQLLWNAAGIFYGMTYLVMFAHPDRRLARARLAEDRGALRLCVNVAVRSDLDYSYRSGRKPVSLRGKDQRRPSYRERDWLGDIQGHNKGSTRFHRVRLGSTGFGVPRVRVPGGFHGVRKASTPW